jgi:nucleoside phosphorylase/tetratricopeptide (TPR) repeat protein
MSSSTTLESADIVIFTVNEHETRAVNEAFQQSQPARPVGMRSYWDFGIIGGAKVLHGITQMGDQATSAAARSAIQNLSPKIILCVGIAWGAKPSKWKIGDLLLATRLHDWAHRKESSKDGVIPRGFTIPPRDDLLQITRTAYVDWPLTDVHGRKPEMHDGLLLSNPVLLDDEVERQKALDAHPEAIGGEMEGRGLVWEASQAKVDWLIIKAICDWGAGKNDPGANKEASQILAAENTANFVHHLIAHQLGPAITGHRPDIANVGNSISLASDGDADIQAIAESLAINKLTRSGPERRKALKLAVTKVAALAKDSFNAKEIEARIWHELTYEARNVDELEDAWVNTIRASERLIEHPAMTVEQESRGFGRLTEWSIDFAQSLMSSTSVDSSLKQLNAARKRISKRLGLKPLESAQDPRQVALLLCLRAKCDRAAASLLRRRGQRDPRVRAEVNRRKNDALDDSNQAFGIVEDERTTLEYALCLFAQSGSPGSDLAKKAMVLLEDAVRNGAGAVTRYELVRQYHLRFRFLDAIHCFEQIQDSTRTRFLFNAHYYASSVIGLHYDNYEGMETRRLALVALPRIDELIAIERHTARDVVDLVYLRAICDWPIADSIAPLDALKPTSASSWNEIAKLAKAASNGDLGGALLLGLEDAVNWSRIGSFYLEFAKDAKKAIEFYEGAIMIAPLSPVFYFNKAEALAYGLGDFDGARSCLNYTKALEPHSRAWFRARATKIKNLEAAIFAGGTTDPGSSPK